MKSGLNQQVCQSRSKHGISVIMQKPQEIESKT